MDTDDDALSLLARRVAAAVGSRGLSLATAESCTGGWIAKLLTDIPGSSAWFVAGFVTYSNQAKSNLLGISPGLLEEHGAVSRETAAAMAIGARQRAGAALAAAVTGIAGPGGGTADKPVGTVCLAWSGPGDDCSSRACHFAGDRDAVRRQSVAEALAGLLRAAGDR